MIFIEYTGNSFHSGAAMTATQAGLQDRISQAHAIAELVTSVSLYCDGMEWVWHPQAHQILRVSEEEVGLAGHGKKGHTHSNTRAILIRKGVSRDRSHTVY